jgi:hypothetical protein
MTKESITEIPEMRDRKKLARFVTSFAYHLVPDWPQVRRSRHIRLPTVVRERHPHL